MNTFKKIGLFFCIGIIGVVFGVVAAMQWHNLGAADTTAHKHPLTKVTGHAATCQETGIKDYWECPDCAKYFADAEGLVEMTSTELANWKVIKKAHHETNEHHHVAEIKANCAHDGNIEYYTCIYCGDYFDDANCKIPVSNDFIKYNKTNNHEIIFVKATTAKCNQPGMAAHYECQVCGQKYTDKNGETTTTAEALVITVEHELIPVAAVEATCTTEGNIAHHHCTECEQNFKNEQALNPIDVTVGKLNHEIEYVEATPATCETAGNHAYYHCSECDGKFTDEACTKIITDYVINALGHNHVAVENKTKSTNRYLYFENICNRDGCNHFNGEFKRTLFAENNVNLNKNLELFVSNDEHIEITIKDENNEEKTILKYFDLYRLDWNNSQNNGQTVKINLVIPDIYDSENAQYSYNGDIVKGILTTLEINLDDVKKNNDLEWYFDWNGDGIFEQTIRIHVENFNA
ncbi:MAG: hypothetical protein IKT33_02240 [Clostridia bacterium]|nr:hypothetical protein [Clostridia bacterium]